MNADSIMEKASKRSKVASKEETEGILKDLVQMVAEIDPSGTTRDFGKRKSFAYYDPYNPDQSSSFAHLRYEDSARLRASLIIEQHKSALADIENQMRGRNVSVADKQRY